MSFLNLSAEFVKSTEINGISPRSLRAPRLQKILACDRGLTKRDAAIIGWYLLMDQNRKTRIFQ